MALSISLDQLLKYALVVLFTFGVYKLTGELAAPLLQRWRIPAFLERDVSYKRAEDEKRFKHLEQLLRATTKKYTRHTVSQFLSLSICLFVVTYLLMLMGLNNELFLSGTMPSYASFLNKKALLFGWFVAITPYFYKRLKLYLTRHENGYALIEAVELLLMQYRLPGQQGDLYRALYGVTGQLEGSLKRTFLSMVTILQIEGKTAIRDAVELFEYQVQNTWANQLGVLFIKAAKENRNIEKALEKIHNDMLQSKRIMEQEKAEYADTIIMGFFPLILVPASIFGMNAMFEGAVLKMIFSDAKAFQGLIMCIIAVVVGLVSSLILSKPKIEV